MPVITVAQATELRNKGQLDGRDVAVGGWFVEEFPPCAAALDVYFSALEDCEIASFADTKEAAKVCLNGACHLGHTDMAPWLMNDTLEGITDYGSASEVDPIPVVVIGHAKDPRAWFCLPIHEDQCWRDFVADQLAWPIGNGFDQALDARDCARFTALSPKLGLAAVAGILGDANQLVSAAATTAACVSNFDPRWNKTGPQVVWVVRSVPSTSADSSDPTRPVTVSLIDDASGVIVDSKPLALAPRYDPARLWVTETRHEVDPNDHVDVGAFLRVFHDDTPIVESTELGSIYGNRESLVAGPDVLLLDPGVYSLDGWLARRDSGYQTSATPGPAIAECSSDQTFNPGDDVQLNADYQGHHNCTWAPWAEPSSGMP